MQYLIDFKSVERNEPVQDQKNLNKAYSFKNAETVESFQKGYLEVTARGIVLRF